MMKKWPNNGTVKGSKLTPEGIPIVSVDALARLEPELSELGSIEELAGAITSVNPGAGEFIDREYRRAIPEARDQVRASLVILYELLRRAGRE